MSHWRQVRTGIIDLYTTAAEKTEEWTRLGLRHYDRFGLGREIERHLTLLGAEVYRRLTEDPRADLAGNESIQGVIHRIRRLEEERRSKEQEIEGLRQKARKDSQSKSSVAKAGAAEAGSPTEVDDPEYKE